MNTNCLIVTAFYDINRSNWTSYKRTNSEYLDYFRFWARLDANIFVFCENEDTANEIRKIRREFNISEDKTQICILDIFSIESEIYERMKIVASHPLQHAFHIRDNTPETYNANYNYIMLMKTWMVSKAVEITNNFEYAAWLDFGFCHGAEYFADAEDFRFKFSYEKDNGKINMFAIKPIDDTPIFDIIQSGDTYITGGFYIGPSKLWSTLWQQEYEAINSLLNCDLMDDDQILLLMAARKRPDIIQINELKIENGNFTFATGLIWATNHQIKLANRIITKNRKTKNSLIRKQIGWAYICFKYAIRQFKRFKKIVIA